MSASGTAQKPELGLIGELQNWVRRHEIVIAHRLTTIQNANRILVLTEDGISEQGLMMNC